MITFRKATSKDIDRIAEIYSAVHTAEEAGITTTGWKRDTYPVRNTAKMALERGDIFVEEADGKIVCTALLNKIQVDVYEGADWEYPAAPENVMVMHTLAVDPAEFGHKYGPEMVKYYEQYALENNCPYLRMDTNEKNTKARKLYKSLGYKEIGIVPTVFNGIPGVGLVLLEKYIGKQ